MSLFSSPASTFGPGGPPGANHLHLLLRIKFSALDKAPRRSKAILRPQEKLQLATIFIVAGIQASRDWQLHIRYSSDISSRTLIGGMVPRLADADTCYAW